MSRYGDYFRELRAKEQGAASRTAGTQAAAARTGGRTDLAAIDARADREGAAIRQLAAQIAAGQAGARQDETQASPLERLAAEMAGTRELSVPYARSMDDLNRAAAAYRASAPAGAPAAAAGGRLSGTSQGAAPLTAASFGGVSGYRNITPVRQEQPGGLRRIAQGADAAVSGLLGGIGSAVETGRAALGAQVDFLRDVGLKDYFTTPTNQLGERWEDPKYHPQMDMDSAAARLMERSAEKTEAAAEGLGPKGQWIARNLISAGQNVPAMAASLIPAAGPAISGGIMAASAGGSRAYELQQQGLDAGQAFTRGAVSGAIELATEKFSIDSFLELAKGTGARAAVQNLLRQMGVEASEESASYALNYIADRAAQDPNAEFSLAELAESAAGGAFSGGLFGGAGLALNRLGENGQRNYQYLRERDGGRTPDFDRQHEYYYSAARAGLAEDRIPAYPTQTPVDETARRGAQFAGQNDGTAEARETVRQLREGGAVSDAALDRALSFPESRREIEALTGALPGVGSQDRAAVRGWAERQRQAARQSQAIQSQAEQQQAAQQRQAEQSRASAADPVSGGQNRQDAPGLADSEIARSLRAEDREFHDTLLKAAGLRGEIVSQTSDTANAQIENGTVRIYANADDAGSAYRGTVKHEVTHQIRELGGEHYQAFEDFAVAQMAARNEVSVDSLVVSTQEVYRRQAGQELTEAQAREEIAGDFAMTLDIDAETIRRFTGQSEQNRQTAKGILQTIRNILRGIRERFSGRKLSQEQERFVQQLDEGARLWAEALGEASQLAKENAARTDGGTRFSIKRSADGSQYVEVDTDILEGAEEKDIPRILSDIVKNKFHNLITANGQQIGVNSKTTREWRRSKDASKLYKENHQMWKDKVKAFNHADELLKASRDYIGEAQKHQRKDSFIEFARGTVDFQVDDRSYSADVIVGITKDQSAVLYDIVNINNIAEAPANATLAENTADRRHGTPADTSIADSEAEVNENLPKRFSLKKPVEETRNLIAVHNLNSQKLREALKLGGLPMPSVAVVKASEGHADYGEISVVFGRDSIDPQANKANRLYGADAWTPTAPQVNYEANPQTAQRISERLSGLAAEVDPLFRSDLRRVSYDLDGLLNRQGGEDGAVQHVLDNYGLKAAFLEEQGQHIEAVTARKEASKGYDPEHAEKYQALIDALGVTDAAELDGLNLKTLRETHGAALEQAFPGMTKTAFRMSSILHQTQAYMNRSGDAASYETVTDEAATRQAVDAALDRPAYARWVREMFSGLEGKRGIYNGKEALTPSGRRRSFDQLHYAYTLENLVKAMKQEDARGAGTWGVSAKTLQSVTAPEYRSIRAMKDDSGRLGTVDQAYYESVLEEMDGVLDSVITKIQKDNPGGFSVDGIAGLILEAARGKKTVDAIVKTFREAGLKLNNDQAMQLQGLFKASAELPTGYFEAKPQRAVRFSEAVAAIVPDDLDPALREGLEEAGVTVLPYEAGNEQERLEALNSLEDARFSLKGAGDAAARLARYREQYGTLPRGEQAVRDIMFPKRTTEDTRVRRFSRTAAESASLTDEQADAIGAAVAEGRFNYEPVGDKSARHYAETMLSRGADEAAEAWGRVVARDSRASKNDIALGEYLLREAAKAGDTARVVQLTAEIAAEGTRAGQVVQAMRLLKQLDGAGQLISLDAMLKKMQGDLDKGKSGVFLKVSDELRQELAGAKGEAEVNAALDKIYDELAKQLPSTWADKWNAWRYLSMLGNPRTHVRNVLGNAAFEPAIVVKNAIGAALERVFVPEGERTKSLSALLPGTGGRARQFAQADFREMKDIITGGGKMNPTDILRERQRIFKSNTLEWIRKQNFNFLEAEDGVFLEHHYVRAMTQYLKANRIDPAALDPQSRDGMKTLNRAREYAVKEAQRATYRDFSQAAQTISQASRRAGTAGRILIEGVLPFKKTPVNVLRRGVEYSPIGLADAVTRGTARLVSGKISASEFIDGLSAGLTGTGIAALGWLLASTGVLTGGGGDDKEQDFRDALGAQTWALRFGDKTYTIDWLAPSSMPLFTGAEAMRLYENGMELNGRSVMDAAMSIAEPLTQMSMLDGLNSMLTSVRFGDNPLSDLLTGAAADYVSQAVPTLLGQIARTIDPVRRTTYDDKNSGMPSIAQKTLQKNLNKLPYLSRQSAAYLDVWGREQFSGSLAERALQNFLSPGYLKNEALSDMESELIRLYRATGEGSALPGRAAKSFAVQGETRYLTPDEYRLFAETRGTLLYSGLSEITASACYKGLADADKLTAVGNMAELANAVAKTGVSDYQPDGWIAKAIEGKEAHGISLSSYVMAYSAQAGLTGLKNGDGETITNSAGLLKMQAIYGVPGLNDKQRAYLFEACGVGKSVRHYNKAKVEEELRKMEKQAAR